MTAVLKSYPDNIYDVVGKIKEGDVISLLNVPNSPTLTVHAIIESRKSRGVFKNEADIWQWNKVRATIN